MSGTLKLDWLHSLQLLKSEDIYTKHSNLPIGAELHFVQWLDPEGMENSCYEFLLLGQLDLKGFKRNWMPALKKSISAKIDFRRASTPFARWAQTPLSTFGYQRISPLARHSQQNRCQKL